MKWLMKIFSKSKARVAGWLSRSGRFIRGSSGKVASWAKNNKGLLATIAGGVATSLIASSIWSYLQKKETAAAAKLQRLGLRNTEDLDKVMAQRLKREFNRTMTWLDDTQTMSYQDVGKAIENIRILTQLIAHIQDDDARRVIQSALNTYSSLSQLELTTTEPGTSALIQRHFINVSEDRQMPDTIENNLVTLCNIAASGAPLEII